MNHRTGLMALPSLAEAVAAAKIASDNLSDANKADKAAYAAWSAACQATTRAEQEHEKAVKVLHAVLGLIPESPREDE